MGASLLGHRTLKGSESPTFHPCRRKFVRPPPALARAQGLRDIAVLS
ncbi:hypothetical protein [Kamptonema formosum]|nr:hypothetical protein [Oscillatoria sp. PCC 10802]